MTTVVDPAGTPSVTFNLSGVAIVSVTPGPVNNATTAGVIQHFAGETVALAASTVTDSSVIFASDFEVGDVVEVYSNGSAILKLFPASGETINLTGGVTIASHCSAIFRKISSSDWMMTKSV